MKTDRRGFHHSSAVRKARTDRLPVILIFYYEMQCSYYLNTNSIEPRYDYQFPKAILKFSAAIFFIDKLTAEVVAGHVSTVILRIFT